MAGDERGHVLLRGAQVTWPPDSDVPHSTRRCGSTAASVFTCVITSDDKDTPESTDPDALADTRRHRGTATMPG